MSKLTQLLGNNIFTTLSQMPEAKKVLSKSQKRQYDVKTVTSFIESLQDNKDAFDIFKEEAMRKGIYKGSPLPEIHHGYYNKYIKPNLETPRLNRSLMNSTSNNNSVISKKQEAYIPLRDLLRQNHDERVQGYLNSMIDEQPEQKQMKAQFNTVDIRKNITIDHQVSSDDQQDQLKMPFNRRATVRLNPSLQPIHDNNQTGFFQKNKIEIFTPFNIKDNKNETTILLVDSKTLQTPKQLPQLPMNFSTDVTQQTLPDIIQIKKGSIMTSYSPQMRSAKIKNSKLQKDSVIQSQLSTQYEMKIDLQNSNKKKTKNMTTVNASSIGGLQTHLNHNQSSTNYHEENSGGEEDSSMSKNNKNNNIKFRQQINKPKDFQLDRKDVQLQNHFNVFAIDKRLNKTKMKEYLTKRYKEQLAERILKNMMHHFNNFSFNLEFNIFCDSIENFVNQDEAALKQFAFKVLDVNNDKKLSESDLFQVMKWSSGGPSFYSTAEEPQNFSENDLFLEIFSGDFCKIIKNINLKRRVRGKDDAYQNKIKAIEFKLQNMESNQTSMNQSYDNSVSGGGASNLQSSRVNEKISITKFNKKNNVKMNPINPQKNAQVTNLKMMNQMSKESTSSFEEDAKIPQIAADLQQMRKKSSQQQKTRQFSESLNIHISNPANEEQSDFLSINEFNNIQFKNQLPMIVHDLILYLTSKSLIKGNQIWEEDEEQSPNNKNQNTQPQNEAENYQDNELQNWKSMMTTEEYGIFINLFTKFLNIQLNNKKEQLQFKEQSCFMTEEMIIANFKNVFGYECNYFGKLLYIILSNGYDKSKIGISRLIQVFYPLLKKEEQNGAYNRMAFTIYDMDRDGFLNILNLLHLQQNIPPTSIIGQEIFKLMDFYFQRNVKSKTGVRKIEIDFEVFNKLIKKSVLVSELQYKFFGIGQPIVPHIFERNPGIPYIQDYLFKDLDIEEVQFYGQRAFAKNIDKVLADLIKFYNKYYNRQQQQKLELTTNLQDKKKFNKEKQSIVSKILKD